MKVDSQFQIRDYDCLAEDWEAEILKNGTLDLCRKSIQLHATTVSISKAKSFFLGSYYLESIYNVAPVVTWNYNISFSQVII